MAVAVHVLSRFSLLDDFCELIYTVLVKQFEYSRCAHECLHLAGQNEDTSRHLENCACRFKTEPNLAKGCVLERILSIQKFDQVGLDYYEKLCSELSNTDKPGEFGYVDKLVNELGKYKCARCTVASYVYDGVVQESKGGGGPGRGETELDLVPYLIASVVNDCSLMITCRRVRNVYV